MRFLSTYIIPLISYVSIKINESFKNSSEFSHPGKLETEIQLQNKRKPKMTNLSIYLKTSTIRKLLLEPWFANYVTLTEHNIEDLNI